MYCPRHHQNSHHALMYCILTFMLALGWHIVSSQNRCIQYRNLHCCTILTSGTIILSLTAYFDLRYKSHSILYTVNITGNHVILYDISCSKLYKHSDNHVPCSFLSSTCINKHPESSCSIIYLERLYCKAIIHPISSLL
jgi:hypothetical protein